MNEPDATTELRRGIRVDLVIAICALLISSLATAASWWQSRVVAEQLSAQVWPYVSFAESYGDDTVSISISNDGLGPAVLRTAAVLVDGKPQASFVDAMHALIGPHLVQRAKRAGDKALRAGYTTGGPGTVLRAGATATVFSLHSRTFAPQVGRASTRLQLRACYCSIEGACWSKDSRTDDPRPVRVCPAEPANMLLAHPSLAGL